VNNRNAWLVALVAMGAALGAHFAKTDYSFWIQLAAVGIAVVGLLLLRHTVLAVAIAVTSAITFFSVDNFWGVVVSGAAALWLLVTMLPTMDLAWRTKVGFVASTFALCFVSLWPTLHSVSNGRLPLPAYVRDRIKFGIVKGLDLQGGARLVYVVEVDEAIRDKRDHIADEMRHDLAVAYQFHSGDGILKLETLTKLAEKVTVSTPAGDTALIRISFKDAGDLNGKIDERFIKKFSGELARLNSADTAVASFKIKAEVETQIRDRAVNQAKDTVNRRVDELGLREASVTVRDENVIVEVPGQEKKAFEDIKDLIRKTARLEFKMVDVETDFFEKAPKDDNERITINVVNVPAGPGKTVQRHYATIRKRDDETMTQCRERFKKWVQTLNVPDDHQVSFEANTGYDEETNVTSEHGWDAWYLYSRSDVTGQDINDATVAPPDSNNQYSVSLSFTPGGGDRFEEVTGANVGRRFAIVLDDVIQSMPVIRTKIAGGHASITMGAGDPVKQLEDAKKLELVLRAGALPAPITLDTETQIGPTLGEDAISKGVIGAIGGSLLVLLFMLVYYRKSGIVADVAVLFNLMIQMAILASFSATMTLPGIAGLALTIGMAVDANVLINERIREELRAGRSARAAVEAGYDKAFASIVDGHVTVFISGLILSQYGTGPVKGFAITLIVGIIASLFTGVFCTRLVFDYWVRGAKVKELSVGIKV
jgi:preprotein translocase subunit SecD